MFLYHKPQNLDHFHLRHLLEVNSAQENIFSFKILIWVVMPEACYISAAMKTAETKYMNIALTSEL